MYENRHARFTAVDPLLASGKSANPQSFNRYVYVMNSPLALTDPSGLCPTGGCGDYTGTVYTNGTRFEREAFEGSRVFGGDTTVTDDASNTSYRITPAGWNQIRERQSLSFLGSLGQAGSDTAIGGGGTLYNGAAAISNGFGFIANRMTFQYFVTGQPRNEFQSVPYYEPSTPGEQSAAYATTFLMMASGGFTSSARSTSSFTFQSGSTTASEAVVYEQYALRAIEDGMYPIMQRGFKEPQGEMFLNKGDVWKFGTTKNPTTRYRQPFLNNTGNGLRYDTQFKALTEPAVLQMERFKIQNYRATNLFLPPGNKMVK